MARNKLRARREDIVGNVPRGERGWRGLDSPSTAQKKVEAKSKAKPKAKAKKKSGK